MRASPIGDNGGGGGGGKLLTWFSLQTLQRYFGYPLQLHDCKQKAEAMQQEEHAGSTCLDDCCLCIYLYLSCV